jgi:hypothetical protein
MGRFPLLTAIAPLVAWGCITSLAPGVCHALPLIAWHSVDGGGRTFSTGAGWSLGGTIGQPDAGLLSGGSYLLRGGFWRGGVTFSTSVEGGDPVVAPGPAITYRWAGASPNPFNPLTVVRFDLPEARAVELRVYDAAGRLVRELAGGVFAAGTHRVTWDGRDGDGRAASSGVYYLRFTAGEDRAAQKIVLVK